jgi:hypothetical protein
LRVTRLTRRLQKLEARQPRGCPTCQHWCGTVLQDDDGMWSRSDRCPDCDRLVPIRVVAQILDVPLAAL